MKIFYSLPQMQHKGDAYIFGVVRIAFWAFLLISSITVFSGVQAFLGGYLTTLPWLVGAVAMVVGFLAFSLAPDYINARIVRYVTRTILQNTFRDARSGVILVFCVMLVVYLTRYSYKMSQFAAGASVEEMAGDAQQADVVALDSIYLGKIEATNAQLVADQDRIRQRYAQRITEATAENEAKIRGEETLIKGLESSRSKTNSQWIDNQIRTHERRIAEYRRRIAAATTPLREKEQSELDDLDTRYRAKDSLLTTVYTGTRDTTLLTNADRKLQHAQITGFFKDQLSGIAGKAVFIILILSVITEIIYERNGITPDPVFSPFDFQPSAILEALAMPVAWAGRHLTNRVRTVYNNLPDLVEREDLKQLRDPGDRQRITRDKKPVSGFETNSEIPALSMPLSVSKPVYIRPESKAAESAESLESTRKVIETAGSVIAQLKENRRKILQYIWKIKNPKSGGKRETCIQNIQRLNQESLALIQSFTTQLKHDTETLYTFRQQLIQYEIAKPGNTEGEVIYIDRLEGIK